MLSSMATLEPVMPALALRAIEMTRTICVSHQSPSELRAVLDYAEAIADGRVTDFASASRALRCYVMMATGLFECAPSEADVRCVGICVGLATMGVGTLTPAECAAAFDVIAQHYADPHTRGTL